jgi:hypothetical protein
MKMLLRTGKSFLVVALSISFFLMVGCVESTFELANGSRLPRWITLPPGVTRSDVSITLSYYTPLGGDDAKLTLKDKGGKTLAEVWGKMKCHSSFSSYPAYEVVAANGINEIIEHKKMEPVFYITDDTALKGKLLVGGPMPVNEVDGGRAGDPCFNQLS